MSWRAASAAQTSRNAEATTAAPNTAMATGAARCAPESRKTTAGAAIDRASAIFHQLDIPSSVCWPDAAGGGERLSGQDGSWFRRSRSPCRCRVGDRAEAGMSISPTPRERRELLPLLAQVLAGVTGAVNHFHGRGLLCCIAQKRVDRLLHSVMLHSTITVPDGPQDWRNEHG